MPTRVSQLFSPESISAAGLTSDKLDFSILQSKMKCDPEGYESELILIHEQFDSSIALFQQQSVMSFASFNGVGLDSSVNGLGDRAMMLAHVTPIYPKHLSQFPRKLIEFLSYTARSLPSTIRVRFAQALILLVNRKVVDIEETLALFIELQTLDDRNLRSLAFSHVIHSIRRMNKKHKNEAKNRSLQNIVFHTLQLHDETKAKRALITLCDLHRRKVWFDERTANAICTACFHNSSKLLVAALSFLLNYEIVTGDEDDHDDGSCSDDDFAAHKVQVAISKETIYKAYHQGTVSSKKRKKAKLQRVMRSMKKQQRVSTESSVPNQYSPLNHLKDPQGFVEKLFSRLQNCNERFEVRMMMLKVIARAIGLHRLVLLNFYPYMQKYAQPHQRDITSLLAAAVQACHDMVPPDAVEPLFRQIVNQFVHDRSRPEAISVGLNVVREICLRMPLLMTEDLLQDLVLYKKSHEKPVSSAARSLVTLFREVCPSLLVKKDRGRPINPDVRPKAYGESNAATDVPGIELLKDNSDGDDNDSDDAVMEGDVGIEDEDIDDRSVLVKDGSDLVSMEDSDDVSDDGGSASRSDYESISESGDDGIEDGGGEGEEEEDVPNLKKAKLMGFDEQINAATRSLRSLKKLAASRTEHISSDTSEGFLSSEDFQRIKELKAKEGAKIALLKHGLLKKGSESLKIPSSEQLSVMRVDPAKLEAHVRKKLTKEERLALVKAGREERGKYLSRTAVKRKKSGGLSNRQKEHKKAMPIAAKRAKIARCREQKRKKSQRSGKQFRGRKAWK